MKPAWRAACLDYRAARGEGMSEHHAHLAAAAAVLELHPNLTQKEASAEAVSAVAYASTFQKEWFWAPLRAYLSGQGT